VCVGCKRGCASQNCVSLQSYLYGFAQHTMPLTPAQVDEYAGLFAEVRTGGHRSGQSIIDGCQMFICSFCQHNTPRVMASHTHHSILGTDNMIAQELYTASGKWVSMYIAGPGPALSARAFSARCFQQDLNDYRSKVQDMLRNCRICSRDPFYCVVFCRALQTALAGMRQGSALGVCIGSNQAQALISSLVYTLLACIRWLNKFTSSPINQPWLFWYSSQWRTR